MPILDEEASQRAQHILELPHERKNMSTLVTTAALIDSGFLSPDSGTKIEYKVFRDGRPLVDRKHKFSRKRPRGQSLDDISDEGNLGGALSFVFLGRDLYFMRVI